ncbi:MAG: hypothetical protein H6590_08780 [Flavobacteriales bacterium]|nr:hypothetical protein [Flavobacteriales bacterium]HPF91058.1 hypothetical protein [Flavobacteriales bacterium]
MGLKLRALPLLAVLATACGGGEEQHTEDKGPSLVIGNDGAESSVASLYQMPTPNELFSLVRQMAGDGQKRLMNPVSNVDRYATLKARALNFGIYSTDLVFASYFKLNVEVVRYYLTTKKLAESLGIVSAFSDADFVRLEANLTRGDSLEIISNDAYARAYAKLQDEKMGPTLSLVLAGGWVESMHLLLNQIEAHGSSPELMQRVGEQKVTLEHLVDMMRPNGSDADVAAVMTDLLAVRDIYDQVNVKRVVHQGQSTTGRMVLGDDVQVELTDEKYQALKTAVDELRGRMIQPEA